MPPKKLTVDDQVDDQAFVDHWSQRMFYFMKIMRRTNLYVFTLARGVYSAAHKEVAASGLVAGGKQNSDKKTSWQPKCEDRVAYVNTAQDLMDRHYAMSPSPRNNQDLEDTKEERDRHARNYNSRAPLPATREEDDDEENNAIDRDPDEDPNYHPFSRNRETPQEPPIKISRGNWHQYEKIGETYFIKDKNDSTTFTALELAGFLHLKKGKFYNIRYEGSVDSIRITEREFFAILEDGMWF